MPERIASHAPAVTVDSLRRSYDTAPGANDTTKRSSYLPTLDGWRAIAIIAVILTHASLLQVGALNDKWLFLEGGKGVDVFFAISGILICSRLLDEEEQNGRISLRNFYVRRAFRILPAAIFYLAILGLLSSLCIIKVYPGEWWASLLFYRNYTRLLHLPVSSHSAWFTGHFWSLSVEEHFYVILPPLLVLFRRTDRRVCAMGLLALGVIAHRVLELRVRPYDLISFHSDVRLDALLIPAILAVLIRIPFWTKLLRPVLIWWNVLVILALALIASSWDDAWKSTGLAIVLPCIVMGSITYSTTWFGRLLELRPLKFIGKISYSLYLWQMLFFTGHLYPSKPLGAC